MLLKKLVIAEDDDAVAHLVAAAMGDAGFLCLRAKDGEEALHRVRSELPDALICDVMMPKLSGIDVCKKLKEDVVLSRTPILMLTSMDSVDDRIAGLEAGADDYLGKPFDLRELAARVKALVRQSRRERDRNAITNLPGSETIEEYIEQRLRDPAGFGAIYLDVENYHAYAAVYGLRAGEEVIADIGQTILAQTRDVGGDGCFVGHLGGDDFFILCATERVSELATAIEHACRKRVPEHYSEEDRQRGYVQPRDTAGKPAEPVQFMNPAVAKMSVQSGQFKNAEELASELTAVKAATRKHTASGIFRAPPEFSSK